MGDSLRTWDSPGTAAGHRRTVLIVTTPYKLDGYRVIVGIPGRAGVARGAQRNTLTPTAGNAAPNGTRSSLVRLGAELFQAAMADIAEPQTGSPHPAAAAPRSSTAVVAEVSKYGSPNYS